MTNLLILATALPLLAGLLYSAKRESIRGSLLTKPFLSGLFILAALTGSHGNPKYFEPVLAGLLFCLVGDIFLIFFSSRKLFLVGLLSFLTGHVLYTVAFFSLSSPGGLTWVIGAVCLATGGAIFAWLRPHLGSMRIPVMAYVAIITAMVIGAASLMGDDSLAFSGRVLAFSGAVLFYFSDIFVARHRFVKKEFANRLMGLPLYYAGQFMIAFSTGFL